MTPNSNGRSKVTSADSKSIATITVRPCQPGPYRPPHPPPNQLLAPLKHAVPMPSWPPATRPLHPPSPPLSPNQLLGLSCTEAVSIPSHSPLLPPPVMYCIAPHLHRILSPRVPPSPTAPPGPSFGDKSEAILGGSAGQELIPVVSKEKCNSSGSRGLKCSSSYCAGHSIRLGWECRPVKASITKHAYRLADAQQTQIDLLVATHSNMVTSRRGGMLSACERGDCEWQ